jgi:hypothetical protein
VQVIGMFVGGNLSFGLSTLDTLGGHGRGDNGVYVIDSETLTIKGREEWDASWGEQDEYDLNEFTNEIINRINAMNEYANKDASEYSKLEILPTAEEFDKLQGK